VRLCSSRPFINTTPARAMYIYLLARSGTTLIPVSWLLADKDYG